MSLCSLHVLNSLPKMMCVHGGCRCIDKAGGLDRYLLKTSDQDLASDIGVKLRTEIIANRQLLRARGESALPFAASAEPETSSLL